MQHKLLMGSGNNFLDAVFICIMALSLLIGVAYLAWAIKGTLDGSSWDRVFSRYALCFLFIGMSSSVIMFLP